MLKEVYFVKNCKLSILKGYVDLRVLEAEFKILTGYKFVNDSTHKRKSNNERNQED